jgi:O-antigen ligase
MNSRLAFNWPMARLWQWIEAHKKFWPRLLIIALIFALSAALPTRPSSRLIFLIPALPVIAAALVSGTRQPALGLVAVIGTIIIPLNGPSGVNATMGLVALLLALWIFESIIQRDAFTLVPTPTNVPLFIFLGICILAFLVGQLPWYLAGHHATLGAQLGGLTIILLSAAAFLLTANRIPELRWLEWMVWLFMALSAVHIVGWFSPALNRFTSMVFQAGIANGSLFWLWGAVLPFSQAVFNTKLKFQWRVGFGVLAAIIVYVAFFMLRDWNSGWTPMLIGLAGVVWAAAPRYSLLFLAGGVVVGFSKIQAIMGIIFIGDNEYSLGTRLDAWSIIWKMTKVNPILGLGIANYNAYTPLFPIRGYAVNFNSHSQYIDLIAQTGILGLLCYLWFFAAIGWLAWRLRTRAPEGFARAYVYGAIGGLFGTLVAGALGDWVLPFFFNIAMYGFRASVLSWLFLGGLVAIDQAVRKQQNSTIPAE